jgi:small subunit ribosomal protein S16
MAVKIRLTRLGKKKQPTYRVVVMDSRKPRDGKYIEQLGIYDPRQEPSLIRIDNDRALHWLKTGAQPTERAQKLLEISGAWTQFKVAKGDIHTVGEQPVDDSSIGEQPVDDSSIGEQAADDSSTVEVEAVAEPAVDEAAVETVTEEIVEETAADETDAS